MHEEELEVAIKVVVVGNGAVGKSSLIQRYCKGIFTKEYKKTIGVDFLERQMQVSGEECRLMVWDTAGQEEFDAITRAYYRGAQVCIIAFSTVDRDSFLAIESWKRKVEAEVSDVVMCVVQNKTDLIDEACMTPEEVDQMVKSLRLKLFRTSVKENFNVDQVFEFMASKYLEKRRKQEAKMATSQTAPSIVSQNGHPKISEASSSLSVSNGSGGQSFQIKPAKQKPKKKPSVCILL